MPVEQVEWITEAPAEYPVDLPAPGGEIVVCGFMTQALGEVEAVPVPARTDPQG